MNFCKQTLQVAELLVMVQWVQQPGWEGCCGPGQAGRTEAGPGLHLVMGLMHEETKSITAVVMVMTMNQVELGLLNCLSNACLMFVQSRAQQTSSRLPTSVAICRYARY